MNPQHRNTWPQLPLTQIFIFNSALGVDIDIIARHRMVAFVVIWSKLMMHG